MRVCLIVGEEGQVIQTARPKEYILVCVFQTFAHPTSALSDSQVVGVFKIIVLCCPGTGYTLWGDLIQHSFSWQAQHFTGYHMVALFFCGILPFSFCVYRISIQSVVSGTLATMSSLLAA